MKVEKVDVLVIGAGPAGSVAAAILNKHGHQVKVIEKQQFPRFVIGESLLPRCLDNLEKAGLLEAVQAQNFPYKRGASFVRAVEESCTFDFSEQFTDGWEYAYQMPRANFDKTLADEIVRQGVELCYQQSVEAVEFSEDKALVDIQTKDGAPYQVEAKFVVDASGYGRVLPRLLDLGRPSEFSGRTAFFAHVKDSTGTEKAELLTEIIDLGAAWAWVIPIGNGITSIGFIGNADFFDQYGNDYDNNRFEQLLDSHHLLKENYTQNLEFVFAPKVITGYSVGVKKMYGDRFVLVGNSTEFLDPIFSSGVTLATETGVTAGELLSRQLKGEKIDWETEYTDHIQYGIDVFRTYIKEWYTENLQTIFFATKKDPSFKKQICSVLAGYVWDKSNPYVKKHRRAIPLLAEVIRRQKQTTATSQ